MKKPKFIPEYKDIPSERQKMPELPIEERKLNFKEVELGFTEEMALKEAARCLSCRRCIGCGLCLAECDPKAIVYDQEPERLLLEGDALIYTGDGKIYNPDRDSALGYVTCTNVITSYEFERLISPTGPFGGYLLRPSDGEIPQSIAFIQCIGSRNEAIGAEFCSVTCCRRSLLQAKRARQLRGDVNVTIFHKGLRPVGKDGEILLEEIAKSDWVELIEEEVKEVSEGEGGSLKVRFGDGGERKFDLVVLAVGIWAQGEFRKYAKAAGGSVNRFGFVECNLERLMSEESGVAFAGAACGPALPEFSIVGAMAAACLHLAPGAQEKFRSLSGESVVIYGCAYGLNSAGVDESLVKSLETNGFKFGGFYSYLCHKDGRKALAQGLEEAAHIVILGCRKGSHEALFESILNLEQGSIAIVDAKEINGNPLEAVKRALDLSQIPKSKEKPPLSVSIIGGGISGLAAAKGLLRNDLEVHLIEKSADIGRGLRLAAANEGIEQQKVDAFIDSVTSHPNIKLYKNAHLLSYRKDGSKCILSLESDGGEVTLESGAVLVATGSGRFDPAQAGYSESSNVLTQDDFAELLNGGEVKAKHIIMIQCIGARDGQHRYCSRFCCRQALQNALTYKANVEDGRVTIIHKGLRLYGFEEILLGEALDKGIEFVSAEGKVDISGEGPLRVKARSKNEELELEGDMVVLSVAHDNTAIHTMLAEKTGIHIDDLGFIETPEASDPFRTSEDGIFVCGFARKPMVAEEAFLDGLAAATVVIRRLRAG